MLADAIYIYLKAHSITTGMTRHQVGDLFDRGRLRNFRKGDNIYLAQGSREYMYILLEGKVKVSELFEDDTELVLEVFSGPDIFGDLDLNGSIDRDEFATALTDNTITLSIRSDIFKSFMLQYPQVAINFSAFLAGKFRRIEKRYCELVFKDAKSRLLSFFNDWAEREGNRNGDKIIISNYLTQSDIASMISVSRQSVVVILNELRDAGFLYYDRKQIEINPLQDVN